MDKICFEPASLNVEKRILSELGFTRDRLKIDIEFLKQWLSYQNHLPPCAIRENDAFFTNFILGCKGSLEKCKQKIDNYYTFRNLSILFNNRNPDNIIDQMDGEITGIWVLPKTASACLFAQCVDDDSSHFDFTRTAKRLMNQMEIFLRMPIVTTNHYWVGDGFGYSATRVLKINPVIIKEFTDLIQNVLPFKIKAIIFINAPHLLEVAINKIVKPLLPTKLAERIFIYSRGAEMLKNHFDTSQLPSDLGGKCKSRKDLNKIWTEMEIESKGWFMNEGAQKAEEEKRPQNDKTDRFGAQGSLRKLEVD